MKSILKIIYSGFVAGIVLLGISISGLCCTIWFFPGLAEQYFDPAFDAQSDRYMWFYIHPFIAGLALAWFWERFKSILRGNFITRGIEFGFIYTIIAIVPMMWLIYSAISVSFVMVLTWVVLGFVQVIFAGLVFEKMNP